MRYKQRVKKKKDNFHAQPAQATREPIHLLAQLQHTLGNQRMGRLVQAQLRNGQNSPRLFSGDSSCSPTWYGSTEPEFDAKGESMTGRLNVTYNDAALKDPCVRECVEQHEAVHVKDLTPVVEKIRDCDVAAGNDWDKKDQCSAMATRELKAARARSECFAYRASFTCLTLKVLDSSSKCSKSPHREEVQKHRGFEACELKNHCKEAGTPALGIPNA